MYGAGLPEKIIMQRSGHKSIEGVRTYRRENQDALNVSNALNSKMAKEPVKNNTLTQDEDDLLLLEACEKYEEKTATAEKQSNAVDVGGLFNAATLKHAIINININK